MFPQGGGGGCVNLHLKLPCSHRSRWSYPHLHPHLVRTHICDTSRRGGGRIQTSAPHVLAIWGLGEVYVFNILLGVCVRAWSLETTSAGGDITRPSCLERKEQNLIFKIRTASRDVRMIRGKMFQKSERA